MVIPTDNLSPTMLKLVQILSDGNYHPMKEVAKKLDEQMEMSALTTLTYRTKSALRLKGFTIVAETYQDKSCYRLARYLDNDDE